MSNESNSGIGVGFYGLLFIVFLVLKLTGVINWSWWWVTAPLWGGLAIVFAIFAIVALFWFGAILLSKRLRR